MDSTTTARLRVLYQSQMWLNRREEARLRRYMNRLTQTKQELKTKLAGACQAFRAEAAACEEEVTRLEAEEDSLRLPLKASTERLSAMQRAGQLGTPEYESEAAARAALWEPLESVITRRNEAMRRQRAAQVTVTFIRGALGLGPGMGAGGSDGLDSSDLLLVDEGVTAAVSRLGHARERESRIRQELQEVITAREQVTAQFIATNGGAGATPDSANANPLDLFTFDFRKRRVLHRLCEEIQLAALVPDRARRRITLTNCFVGVELLDWLRSNGSGIVRDEDDTAELCALLLKAGLIDMLDTMRIPELPRPTTGRGTGSSAAASDSPPSVYQLFRFRCDASVCREQSNKQGWLDKLSKWRAYKRYFYWDNEMQCLSYYHSPKDTSPQRVYWLDGSTVIRTIDRGLGADPGHMFQIVLSHEQNGERALVLAASSAKERKEWMRLLWLAGCQHRAETDAAAATASATPSDSALPSPSSGSGSGSVSPRGSASGADAEARLSSELAVRRAKMRLRLAAAFSSVRLPDEPSFEPAGATSPRDPLDPHVLKRQEKEHKAARLLRQEELERRRRGIEAARGDAEQEREEAEVRALLDALPHGDPASELGDREEALLVSPEKRARLSTSSSISSALPSPSPSFSSESGSGESLALPLPRSRTRSLSAGRPADASGSGSGDATANASPEGHAEGEGGELSPEQRAVLREMREELTSLLSSHANPLGQLMTTFLTLFSGLYTSPRIIGCSIKPKPRPQSRPVAAASICLPASLVLGVTLPVEPEPIPAPGPERHAAAGAPPSASPSPFLSPSPTAATASSSSSSPVSASLPASACPPVPAYPYPSHLRRLLKCAAEDVRTFQWQLASLVAIEGVLAAPPSAPALPPEAASEAAEAAIRSLVFARLHPLLMPMYEVLCAEEDAKLAYRRREFRTLSFSSLGLAPSLCLDERQRARREEKLASPAQEDELGAGSASPRPEAVADSEPGSAADAQPPDGEGAEARGERQDAGAETSCLRSSAASSEAVSPALAAYPNPRSPYRRALVQFCSTMPLTDPTAKLEALLAVSRALCASVDAFNASHGQEQKAAPIVIGADDLLLLFAYLIAWGDDSMDRLHAELQYIDDLMHEKHRCMMTGYYLATTQAALEYVMTHQIDNSE